MAESLFWFDYETFGLDPARDRPAQFAGQRTDCDLNPIGDPLTVYCQPPRDYIPNPESCLITGITPIKARDLGVTENEFIDRILVELARPSTCGVGYNSIRFDDEVTRNSLYRNLRDPFAREWQHGNSRWDFLNVIRMARALRPEGLEWPKDESGKLTLKLDHLTVANGIAHHDAHDALGDVRATLALARLLKNEQPKLYQYLWTLRLKRAVLALINPGSLSPFLMASGRMPAESLHLGMVVVLGSQPENPNALIIYNLKYDPQAWMSDAETVSDPGGPFGLLHINRAPALAPLSVLRAEDEARLGLDVQKHLQHLSTLEKLPYRSAPGYLALTKAFPVEATPDADVNLYGGFASDQDRQRMEVFRTPGDPHFLQLPKHFDDQRYREMCIRFKARNHPEQLNPDEREAWNEFCRSRWFDKAHGAAMSLDEFQERLKTLKSEHCQDPRKLALLDATESYVSALTQPLGLA